MPQEDAQSANLNLSQLLGGAAKAISRVHYCWLVTEALNGGANARPMGRVRHYADEKDWTIRFVTDGRSRKVLDIRRTGAVDLLFQDDPEDAFVILNGAAQLLEGASAVRQHWKHAYALYFPSATDRANAAFVEVSVKRMTLWIRGVTPEPFGLHPTVLERDTAGCWHLREASDH